MTPPTHRDAPGVALPGLAASALFALGLSLAFLDLRSSNRPHELTSSPWVAGLLLVNVFVCWRFVRGLLRAWRREGRSLGRGTALVLLSVYAGTLFALNVLVLLAALGNLPAVLRN